MNRVAHLNSKISRTNPERFVKNSIISSTSPEQYDQVNGCVRRGCQKPGIREFEIKHTNMIGFLCGSCSSELINLGLIAEEVKDRFDTEK